MLLTILILLVVIKALTLSFRLSNLSSSFTSYTMEQLLLFPLIVLFPILFHKVAYQHSNYVVEVPRLIFFKFFSLVVSRPIFFLFACLHLLICLTLSFQFLLHNIRLLAITYSIFIPIKDILISSFHLHQFSSFHIIIANWAVGIRRMRSNYRNPFVLIHRCQIFLLFPSSLFFLRIGHPLTSSRGHNCRLIVVFFTYLFFHALCTNLVVSIRIRGQNYHTSFTLILCSSGYKFKLFYHPADNFTSTNLLNTFILLL